MYIYNTIPDTFWIQYSIPLLPSICSGGVRWFTCAFVAGGFAEDRKEWIHWLLLGWPRLLKTPIGDPGESRWHVWDYSWEWQPSCLACHSDFPQTAERSELCIPLFSWCLGEKPPRMCFLEINLWQKARILVQHLFKIPFLHTNCWKF